MNNKDYYNILKVPEDADLKTIKKAYKKLAIKWHPDKNNDKTAEKVFKNISEAYQILSDKDKRKEYDNMRQFGSNHHNITFISPFDLFNNFLVLVLDLIHFLKWRNIFLKWKNIFLIWKIILVIIIKVVNGIKKGIGFLIKNIQIQKKKLKKIKKI